MTAPKCSSLSAGTSLFTATAHPMGAEIARLPVPPAAALAREAEQVPAPASPAVAAPAASQGIGRLVLVGAGLVVGGTAILAIGALLLGLLAWLALR